MLTSNSSISAPLRSRLRVGEGEGKAVRVRAAEGLAVANSGIGGKNKVRIIVSRKVGLNVDFPIRASLALDKLGRGETGRR
jgi:hypothetical protein